MLRKNKMNGYLIFVGFVGLILGIALKEESILSFWFGVIIGIILIVTGIIKE